jgi:itaconate CoA-transferase
MSTFQDLYRSHLMSPEEALRDLPKNSSVLLGFLATQPPARVRALADRARAGTLDEAHVYYMHATPATAESLMHPELMDVIRLPCCR